MKQVSELLGSFGDNELSPECLDGAQRFLKPDGISIPSSYWPFPRFVLYNPTSLRSFVLGVLIFLIIWLFPCVLLQIHKFYPTSNSIKTTQWCKCLCDSIDTCRVSIQLKVNWFCRLKHTKILHILKLRMLSSYTELQDLHLHKRLETTLSAQCALSLIMPFLQ